MLSQYANLHKYKGYDARPPSLDPGYNRPDGNAPARRDPAGYWTHQNTLAGLPGQFGGLYKDFFDTNTAGAGQNFQIYTGGLDNLTSQYGSGVAQAGSDYMNNLGGTYGAYANAIQGLGAGQGQNAADMFGHYGQGYDSYNQALGQAMQGYTGAQGNYGNALSNVANAMGNEGAARYHSIGDIAQGDFGALGTLSNAALAGYGGISNSAIANASANNQAYYNALAILSNENQNALSDFGISQNQGLANLGQGVANVGIEDIRSRDQALTGAGNAYANLGGAIESERLRALTGLGQSAAALGGNLGQSYANIMSGAAPYLIDKDESSSTESTVNLGGLFDAFGGGGEPTTVTAVGPNGEIINTANVTGGGSGGGGGGSITAGGTKISETESTQSPNELMGGALGGAYGGVDSAGAAGFGQLGTLQGLVNNQDLGARAYGGIDDVMAEIRNREAANQAYSELDKIRLGIQDSEIPGMLTTNFDNARGQMGDAYNQSIIDNRSMLDDLRGGFIGLANQGYGEIGKARDAAYDMVGKSGTDYSGILSDLGGAFRDTRDSIGGVESGIRQGFDDFRSDFGRAQGSLEASNQLANRGMGLLTNQLGGVQNRLGGGYGMQLGAFGNMFDTQGGRLDREYDQLADQQQQNYVGGNETLKDLFDDNLGGNPFFMTPEEKQAEDQRFIKQAELDRIERARRKYERQMMQRKAARENAKRQRANYMGEQPSPYTGQMVPTWLSPGDEGYQDPVFQGYVI